MKDNSTEIKLTIPFREILDKGVVTKIANYIEETEEDTITYLWYGFLRGMGGIGVGMTKNFMLNPRDKGAATKLIIKIQTDMTNKYHNSKKKWYNITKYFK